jgi:hypothetical protein
MHNYRIRRRGGEYRQKLFKENFFSILGIVGDIETFGNIGTKINLFGQKTKNA